MGQGWSRLTDRVVQIILLEACKLTLEFILCEVLVHRMRVVAADLEPTHHVTHRAAAGRESDHVCHFLRVQLYKKNCCGGPPELFLVGAIADRYS